MSLLYNVANIPMEVIRIKTSIRRKILLSIMIPSLIFILISSIYLFRKVYDNRVGRGAMEIESIAEINIAQIVGKLEDAHHVLSLTSKLIEGLDPIALDSREKCDNAVQAMFVNENIYNAWVAFEPNAFDGRDAQHKTDYPGAPSGRFIMSYVMEGGKVVVAPDMDETILDNPKKCSWYTKPRDTGKAMVDTESGLYTAYDYKVEKKPQYTLALISPIYRDGKVIGCVGVDVVGIMKLSNGLDFTLGYNQTCVSIFYPDGRVFFSLDPSLGKENLNSLRFSHADKIKEAMAKGEPIFLHNEFNRFLNESSFSYFRPIKTPLIENTLFLQVALPEQLVLGDTFTMIIGLGVCFVAVLLILLLLLANVVGQITKPINTITEAADAISYGFLETEIPVFTKSIREIDSLSRTLRRMVEQFQIYKIMQEQYQLNQCIDTALADIIKTAKDKESVFVGVCNVLQEEFRWNKVRMVVMIDNKPIETENMREFYYHPLVLPLVQDRKLTFLNSFSLAHNKLTFFDKNVVSICVLSFEKNKKLAAYIILENTDKNQPLYGTTELALLHAHQILTSWLVKQDFSKGQAGILEESEEIEEVEPTAQIDVDTGDFSENSDAETLYDDPLLNLAKKIKGLNIDYAVEALEGMTDIVSKALKLTARLLPETLVHVTKLLEAKDMIDFAIQIHGLKGTLRNIHAKDLGELAEKLEHAAKENDLVYCQNHFPQFLAEATTFSDDLNAIMPDEDSDSKTIGDKEQLLMALEQAFSAAEDFDSQLAQEHLRSVVAFSYGEAMDIQIKQICNALEEFDCDSACTHILSLKEQLS